jgi:hypothetical protein
MGCSVSSPVFFFVLIPPVLIYYEPKIGFGLLHEDTKKNNKQIKIKKTFLHVKKKYGLFTNH